MKCICKNCKHCLEHPDGKICGKHLIFVHNDDTCEIFENDELFDPTKLVLFTVAVVAIVIFLSKIL
jgi:hypothetical protein